MRIKTIVFLFLLFASTYSFAAQQCEKEAIEQAKKRLAFHSDNDDRVGVDSSATALPSIVNPANRKQQNELATLEQFNNPKYFLEKISKLGTKKSEDRDYVIQHFNGTEVELLNTKDGHQESFSRPDSPYDYANIYDTNGNLKRQTFHFYRQLIGEPIEFNKKGGLINTISRDALFHRIEAIEALREIFQKDKKIDILDTTKVLNVIRRAEDKSPFFEIYTFDPPGAQEYIIYIFDEQTGKELFRISGGMEDDGIIFNIGESVYGNKAIMQAIRGKFLEATQIDILDNPKVIGIYLQDQETRRFYDIFIDFDDDTLKDYLFDNSTGKVLHISEAYINRDHANAIFVEPYSEYIKSTKIEAAKGSQ